MSFEVCPGHNRRLHRSDGRFFYWCSQCALSRRPDNSPPPLSLASASTALDAVPCGGCGSFTVPLVVHGMTLVSRGPPHSWPEVVSPATGAGDSLSPLLCYWRCSPTRRNRPPCISTLLSLCTYLVFRTRKGLGPAVLQMCILVKKIYQRAKQTNRMYCRTAQPFCANRIIDVQLLATDCSVNTHFA